MDNNKVLLDKFVKLHQNFTKLVDQFPVEKREQIIFDKWSLKDLISHLSAWNLLNVDHVKATREKTDLTWVSDVNHFNEVEVDKRKQLDWNSVYQEFVNSGNLLKATFQSLPDDLWNKSCGYQNRYTPQRYLGGMINEYEQHIDQLEKFLK